MSSKVDESIMNTGTPTGLNGVSMLINTLQNGTQEVKNLLGNECDVILECKICRNLFRSVPNFVAHKRSYCRASAGDTVTRQQFASTDDNSNDAQQRSDESTRPKRPASTESLPNLPVTNSGQSDTGVLLKSGRMSAGENRSTASSTSVATKNTFNFLNRLTKRLDACVAEAAKNSTNPDTPVIPIHALPISTKMVPYTTFENGVQVIKNPWILEKLPCKQWSRNGNGSEDGMEDDDARMTMVVPQDAAYRLHGMELRTRRNQDASSTVKEISKREQELYERLASKCAQRCDLSTFQCADCKKVFKTLDTLAFHLTCCHIDEAGGIQGLCYLCGSESNDIQAHIYSIHKAISTKYDDEMALRKKSTVSSSAETSMDSSNAPPAAAALSPPELSAITTISTSDKSTSPERAAFVSSISVTASMNASGQRDGIKKKHSAGNKLHLSAISNYGNKSTPIAATGKDYSRTPPKGPKRKMGKDGEGKEKNGDGGKEKSSEPSGGEKEDGQKGHDGKEPVKEKLADVSPKGNKKMTLVRRFSLTNRGSAKKNEPTSTVIPSPVPAQVAAKSSETAAMLEKNPVSTSAPEKNQTVNAKPDASGKEQNAGKLKHPRILAYKKRKAFKAKKWEQKKNKEEMKKFEEIMKATLEREKSDSSGEEKEEKQDSKAQSSDSRQMRKRTFKSPYNTAEYVNSWPIRKRHHWRNMAEQQSLGKYPDDDEKSDVSEKSKSSSSASVTKKLTKLEKSSEDDPEEKRGPRRSGTSREASFPVSFTQEQRDALDQMMCRKKFTCNKCSSTFSNLPNCERHCYGHFGFVRFKCKSCDIAAFYRTDLRRHLKKDCPVYRDKVATVADMNEYIVPVCMEKPGAVVVWQKQKQKEKGKEGEDVQLEDQNVAKEKDSSKNSEKEKVVKKSLENDSEKQKGGKMSNANKTDTFVKSKSPASTADEEETLASYVNKEKVRLEPSKKEESASKKKTNTTTPKSTAANTEKEKNTSTKPKSSSNSASTTLKRKFPSETEEISKKNARSETEADSSDVEISLASDDSPDPFPSQKSPSSTPHESYDELIWRMCNKTKKLYARKFLFASIESEQKKSSSSSSTPNESKNDGASTSTASTST